MTSGDYIPGSTSGSYPGRSGNRLRALIGSREIFSRLGEAIDAARQSVWMTIAFFARDFELPDGRGTLLGALDRAVARGVDVRLLIWRPNANVALTPIMFAGLPQDREMLRVRGSRIKIRWDCATDRFCQHQKTWLIDAGAESETSFVGGANVTDRSTRFHDLFLEVTGPSASDVRHNFVQRWNEASERDAVDGSWECPSADRLPFPRECSRPQGSSVVQVQRMMHAARYFDGHPAPGGNAFDIGRGERSIAEQYELAINAARHTIYIENQAIPIVSIAVPLAKALERGVDVVMLVPETPEPYVVAARHNPSERVRFEGVEMLGRYPNFMLAGLAGGPYVHAKLMLIDDVWATVGSCNLHAYSLEGHCELNASVWDADFVRGLRCQLFAQHLGVDTRELDDRAALRLYRQAATSIPSRERHPVALSPTQYGLT